MSYSDFVHNVLPWAGVFGIIGFILTVRNLLSRPRLLAQRAAWNSASALAGSAANGTWYETDLFIHNDGTRDCFGTVTLILCLPPGWGITSPPNLTQCEALLEDPQMRSWARFELSLSAPIKRKTSRRLRY